MTRINHRIPNRFISSSTVPSIMGDYSGDWKLGLDVQLHVVMEKLEVGIPAKSGPRKIKTDFTASPERSEVTKRNKRTNFVKLDTRSENSVSVPRRTADKRHVCSICSKSFLYKSRLKLHFRIHSGEKPFGCPVCAKTFTQSIHLKKNSRTHTGEKPYKCTVCSKTFSKSGNVVEHIRTHTGETPYTCPFCGKSTETRSHLNAHIQSHTKEKPFKCPICPKTFSRSTSAKRHSRIHYKVRRSIMCYLCPSTFTTFVGRRAHMDTDHKGEKYPSFFA